MNKVEQMVAAAKAVGEQSVLAPVSESEVNTLIEQAKALGIQGYKITMQQSEYDDLVMKSRSAGEGRIVDLSPTELDGLVARAKAQATLNSVIKNLNTCIENDEDVADEQEQTLEDELQDALNTLANVINRMGGINVSGISILGTMDFDKALQSESANKPPVKAQNVASNRYGVKPDGSKYHNVRGADGRFVRR